MNLRPGIVLQARFASSRLPGKALQVIGRHTVLEHCLTRLLATGVSRVVLATTRRPEDDALVESAERVGVRVYRGSTEDVLGRIAAAAEIYDLDPVIRATGDNPAVDPSAANRLLQALAHSGADYVHESGLPVGAALEVMTAAALHYAASEATTAPDREHVTTFIKGHPNVFRLQTIAAPRELTDPSLSLTVDTAEDLKWVRELFSRVDRVEPALSDLIAAGRALRREVA
jgi:spore coat polysaccharide biosynthesis protein SpsF